MKKIIFATVIVVLIVSLICNIKLYKNNLALKNIIPVSDINLENIQRGSVNIKRIITLKDDNLIMSIAKYNPNTPANWHVHPYGQVLYITEGKGYYQEENEPVRRIKAGDVIITKPDIKSWHGSTKDNALEVMAIFPYKENVINMLEPVDNDFYDSL